MGALPEPAALAVERFAHFHEGFRQALFRREPGWTDEQARRLARAAFAKCFPGDAALLPRFEKITGL